MLSPNWCLGNVVGRMNLPELSKPATRLNFGTKFSKLYARAPLIAKNREPPIWAAYAKMKRKRGPLNASLVSKMKKKAEEGYKTGGDKARGTKKGQSGCSSLLFSLSLSLSLATVHNERESATSRFLTHSLCKFNQSVIKFNFKALVTSQVKKGEWRACQQKDHRQEERGNNCLFIRDYSWARPERARFD